MTKCNIVRASCAMLHIFDNVLKTFHHFACCTSLRPKGKITIKTVPEGTQLTESERRLILELFERCWSVWSEKTHGSPNNDPSEDKATNDSTRQQQYRFLCLHYP
jgi:hypothetical protein